MHMVTCTECGVRFDRDKYPAIQISTRRYKHENCQASNQISKDEQILRDYILKLYELDSISPLINKQIKDYIECYHFTYNGIFKTLYYFYNIKHNPVDKSKGIGIVLYVAREAKAYYDKLDAINSINSKELNDYIPKTITVKINKPKPKKKKKHLFSFLEGDNI